MVRPKIFIGFSSNFHSYFHSVHWDRRELAKSSNSLCYNGYLVAAICLRRSVRLSAIMAMNSELVGLPLILLTV